MKAPRGPGRPRNPLVGEPVTVDTWPGAHWRVLRITDGMYRLLRIDRSQGRRVELADILARRLRVIF